MTKYLGHFDSGMTIGFYSHALFFGKKRLECAQKKVLNMGWEKWLEEFLKKCPNPFYEQTETNAHTVARTNEHTHTVARTNEHADKVYWHTGKYVFRT